MLFRDSVNTGLADTSLPDLLDQARRGVAGAVHVVMAYVGRRRGIRLPKVSERWLAGHEADSGKHRNGD